MPAVRRALGDGEDGRRYIVTVPGRGYQFVEVVASPAGAVEQQARKAELPAIDASASTPSGWVGWFLARWKAVTAVALVLVVTSILALTVSHRGAAPPHALAVLPFKPLVPDERDPVLEFVLQEMLVTAKSRYVSSYDIATAYASLREHDAALHWLERALEERAQPVAWLPLDPAFDALHGDPRFERLVERLALR